jgi:hypothetical protein
MMEEEPVATIEDSDNENAALEFKAEFDPTAPQDWCEIIKDIVAIANSGGGLILFGVNDDGSPAGHELERILAIDPAVLMDKIAKYTEQRFAGFALSRGLRHGSPVVILTVSSVSLPMVFTAPGTYDVGGGKQKTAFSKGTVYFRHGAKSEPGTTEDLRLALGRELDRIRSTWLDGIKKVVTAPAGATISVVPREVHLSGAEGGTSVRLVTDENAPAFKAVRTDLLYPYRQKELVARVNTLLGGVTITSHDVHCIRKVHGVDAEPNFFYKPQFSSPQYSEAFAQWIVEQHQSDPEFFHTVREALRKRESSQSR